MKLLSPVLLHNLFDQYMKFQVDDFHCFEDTARTKSARTDKLTEKYTDRYMDGQGDPSIPKQTSFGWGLIMRTFSGYYGEGNKV